MVFCILDSNVPYKRVCEAFQAIIDSWVMHFDDAKLLSKFLNDLGFYGIRRILKNAHYPWYNTKARFLLRWAKSSYSGPEKLREASREELVENITGISWKLASLFLRNTRKLRVAVLDRHVCRWLGVPFPLTTKANYEAAEQKFLKKANALGLDPYDLDLKIWEESRIKN